MLLLEKEMCELGSPHAPLNLNNYQDVTGKDGITTGCENEVIIFPYLKDNTVMEFHTKLMFPPKVIY